MTAVTFFRPAAARSEGGFAAFLAFLRPVVLLAALAFFAGFGGYLILGPPQVLAQDRPAAEAAAPSAAIPADAPTGEGAMPDWNLPKRI